MKKLLLISILIFSTSIIFGQFTINYSGVLTNHPSTAVTMYLEVDSLIVDSTLTSTSTASYSDSTNVSTRPFMIRILMYNCHGVQVADWHSPAPALTTYNVTFDTLDYCPPSPCQASFTKHQAIDPVTRLPIPNKAILIDGSTGSGLTYSWDFGDSSAPQTGLNVSHTYATHGSYNVCLTVTSATVAGICTSVFCDTLTVDSTGSVRGAFTVTTGSSLSSIEENKNINSVKLYPNPAQDIATIDFETTNATNLTIRIIDIKGAIIQTLDKNTFSGNNKIQLNTSDLEEGMYLIQLQGSSSIVTKRLQVVK